jgi:hypothetical protein
VAHELLDGRQVGPRVEEVAGIGPTQVMRRGGGQAGGQGAAGEDLANGLAGQGAPEAEVAGAVDPTKQRAWGIAS